MVVAQNFKIAFICVGAMISSLWVMGTWKRLFYIERFHPALFLNLRWNEEKLNAMVYIEVDFTEIDNGLLLWHMMLQNHLKYYLRLMQNQRKNHLKMIALTLLKAAFKFLNTFAE